MRSTSVSVLRQELITFWQDVKRGASLVKENHRQSESASSFIEITDQYSLNATKGSLNHSKYGDMISVFCQPAAAQSH